MRGAAVPQICPRCGGGPVAAIHWDPFYLSVNDRADVTNGRAILARSGMSRLVYAARRDLPSWGCIGCVPSWDEMHRLAWQDFDWQEAKAAAVMAQDFEEAARLLDLQKGLLPQQAILAEPLLRCLIPNPRTGTIDPQWRTRTAVLLARQMHESRDFSAMPILADALQDAGCDNADILDHCRGPGPHVRGCWVVNLVLA